MRELLKKCQQLADEYGPEYALTFFQERTKILLEDSATPEMARLGIKHLLSLLADPGSHGQFNQRLFSNAGGDRKEGK